MSVRVSPCILGVTFQRRYMFDDAPITMNRGGGVHVSKMHIYVIKYTIKVFFFPNKLQQIQISASSCN